jgi:hypothetical protein
MGTTKTRGVILAAESEVLPVRGVHGSSGRANLGTRKKGFRLYDALMLMLSGGGPTMVTKRRTPAPHRSIYSV